jgi:hypothetical protein
MCEKIAFFGSKRGAEIIAKVQSLDGTAHKEILNRLYSILTTLDAKANGLLRVNSFFITMLVFFIGWSHSGTFPETLRDYVYIAYLDVLLLVISSFLCLAVVSVSWKFLGYATPDNATYKFDKEVDYLANAVDDRTHFYIIAWWLTLIAFLLSVASAFAPIRRLSAQIIRYVFV